MAGFDNDVLYADNVDFTGNNLVTGQVTQNGQLLVGSAVAPKIRAYTPTGSNGIVINTGAGTIDFTLSSVPNSALQNSSITISTGAGLSGGGVVTLGGGITLTAPFQPNQLVYEFDDFLSQGTDPGIKLNWGNNTNRIGRASGVAGHDGIVKTDASGAPNFLYMGGGGTAPMILGSGTLSVNWVIRTPTLSAVANRYIMYIGIGDQNGSAEYSDGCYFLYSDNVNSGNWVLKTASGAVRTSQNTSTAVTTSWTNLGVVVDSTAANVTYFINGTQVGTAINTNIPTGAVCPAFGVVSTAGAEPGIFLDIMYYVRSFTTAR